MTVHPGILSMRIPKIRFTKKHLIFADIPKKFLCPRAPVLSQLRRAEHKRKALMEHSYSIASLLSEKFFVENQCEEQLDR